jgi:thioredoxin-like negative regulator of GroEL
MLERLVLIAAVAALVVAVVLVVRMRNARRMNALRSNAPNWTVLNETPDDRRTVIAFSTPSCAACHQAQSPAIARAQGHFNHGDVRLIAIDAASQPEAARAFGIVTVPATVVVAAGGQRIVAVNQGFAPSTRLVQQLQLA